MILTTFQVKVTKVTKVVKYPSRVKTNNKTWYHHIVDQSNILWKVQQNITSFLVLGFDGFSGKDFRLRGNHILQAWWHFSNTFSINQDNKIGFFLFRITVLERHVYNKFVSDNYKISYIEQQSSFWDVSDILPYIPDISHFFSTAQFLAQFFSVNCKEKDVATKRWKCDKTPSVMWRNLNFLHITDVQKFQISPHLVCEEILIVSTWWLGRHLRISTWQMYSNLKVLHMTDFFPRVRPVTNIRYAPIYMCFRYIPIYVCFRYTPIYMCFRYTLPYM